MSQILEVLFTTTLNNDNASCHAQDLRTGTDLMKYKGGGSVQSNGLDLIQSNYVIAANSMKPLLHVWPINAQEQMSSIRFVVPGKVNAMALTPDGAYLVAGIQESIYIWHMNTGRMLNTLSKHYQAVTCLRFTDNGEQFVSAGKDGAVLVWNLTRTVSPLDAADDEAHTPMYSFNDHGLAVTDVHIGIGTQCAYLYTVSLDRCCKIYDLSTGTLLLNVVFPVALHSIIVNLLETSVYVGSSEGQILVFNLTATPRMKEYHVEPEQIQAFNGHTTGLPITCLVLSLNGQQLISGGEDKQVCIWDANSRQLLKTIPQNGAVTNLRVRLTNPSIFQPEHKQPRLFADSLKRMMTPRSMDDDEYITLLITEQCREDLLATDDTYDHYSDNDTDDYDGKECGEDYDDIELSEDEENENEAAGTAKKNKSKSKNEAAADDDGEDEDEANEDELNEEELDEEELNEEELDEEELNEEELDEEELNEEELNEDEDDALKNTERTCDNDNVESNCENAAVKKPANSHNHSASKTGRKKHKPTGLIDEPSSSKTLTDVSKFTATDIEKLVLENKELKVRTQRLFEAFFKYMAEDGKDGGPDAKRLRESE